MNRTNYPAVFRQHPARNWRTNQIELELHGSQRFLAPTARECKGFDPERTDWSELTIVIVCGVGFAILVWQPWRYLP